MNTMGASIPASASLSLEAEDVGIVDLEIGDVRRLLAHAAGVEAGPEDDHLPAAVAELFIDVIVVISRPQLDALPARRKTRGYALGSLPRPLVEKEVNDRIAIERMGFLILLRAILGHDEGRAGNVLNFGQAISPCRRRVLLGHDMADRGAERKRSLRPPLSPPARTPPRMRKA